MIRSKLILIFSFLLLVNINGFSQSLTREWPIWFIHPAEYPQIITGFNYNGYSAKNNAIDNYDLFKSCKVVGTLYLYTTSHSPDYGRMSNYKYFFVRDTLKHSIDSLKCIDKYMLDVLSDDYFAAFSFDTTQISKGFKKRITIRKSPKWSRRSFFSKSDFYYGVGMYTSNGDDDDAWITAEERGIFSILVQTNILLFRSKVSKSNSNGKNSFDDIIAYKLNYSIKNIQIMERYPDEKDNVYYVLVRIKKDDLKFLEK